MQWPWSRKPTALALTLDQVLAGWIDIGQPNASGQPVTEGTALALSGLYRAVALISGTLASLPMQAFRDTPDGPQPVGSVFDAPDGDWGQTPFGWKETVFAQLVLHGNAFLYIIRNQAGGIARLLPVHPLSVAVCLPTPDDYRRAETDPSALPLGGKWFDVSLADGTRPRFDAVKICHIPGLSLNGVTGLSLLGTARNSMGTAIAGDQAQAKVFARGALISGIVSPEGDDIDGWDAAGIRRELDSRVLGGDHAGDIAVINRRLNFTPWTMSPADAQFIQARQYSIEEISRWTGVPPHLLMQTDKQSSWGTGIAEQERGMARTVLAPWAGRFEESASRLIPQANRGVRLDFHALERPTPEIENAQVQANYSAGLITLNEARARLHLAPVETGNTFSSGGAGDAQPPAE